MYAPCPWPLHRLQIIVHITGWSVNVVIIWGKIWTVCWVEERLVFQYLNKSSLLYEVEYCHDAQLHLSAFLSIYYNSRFEFLFRHNTIPHTIDHQATALVVLEDGPIKVPKQCQHHCWQKAHFWICRGWWLVFRFHALMFVCRFIVVHSCFITCDKPLQEDISFMILLQKITCMLPHMPICACL